MRLKVSQLVFDFSIFPRTAVAQEHVDSLVEALRCGADFPPILVEQSTMRVIDGFHRAKAVGLLRGPDAEIHATLKQYKDDAECLTDAMRYNASHGRALSILDKRAAVAKAAALNINRDQVAAALNITVLAVGSLGRTQPIPVVAQAPVMRMHQRLPQRPPSEGDWTQRIAARQAARPFQESGTTPLECMNTVIAALNSGTIDLSIRDVRETLSDLRDSIDEALSGHGLTPQEAKHGR